jgi:hypothetical protein
MNGQDVGEQAPPHPPVKKWDPNTTETRFMNQEDNQNSQSISHRPAAIGPHQKMLSHFKKIGEMPIGLLEGNNSKLH